MIKADCYEPEGGIMNKKYSITKAYCQELIKGVCSKCGGKLEPIETENNIGEPTFWAGCKKCNAFCWGVDKIIVNIARKLVLDKRLIAYKHLKEPLKDEKEKYEYWLTSQTDGAVYIVYDVLRYCGVLDKVIEEE